MDLVLTDVRMPKIDGLELMAKIRKHHPEIPVLLISGEPMSDEQKSLVDSADGFLTKPFSIDELNDYISSGIDLRAAMKELSTHLKDPKKIRDAIGAKTAAAEKLFKKGSAQEGAKIIEKLRATVKKAS